MDFQDVMRTRKSVRAYTDRQVDKEDLDYIIEAAQRAPIAGGDRTMSHITVVTDKGLLDEIRGTCMHHKKDGTPVDPLYGAQVLIVLSATGPSDDLIEYCNVACAIENMLLAATDRGLGSTYIWGCLRKLRQHPELVGKLGLPEGYSMLSSLVVGYPVEELAERELADLIAVDWI